MKTKIGLIASLILFIPVLFGFTLVSNANITKGNSTNDTIQIPQKGTVYMYRTGRAMGAIVKSQVKINGQDAGGLGNNSYFEWELDAGVYTFTSYTKESSPVIQIDVKANEKYYIRQDKRIGFTNDGRVTLKEVDESKAKKDMRKAKKIISSYN